MKKKILFVISRYGKDMHGGAEWHCRQIAERLVPHYDVEIATTTAQDYVTWKNYYRAGIEELNGVEIRRFRTSQNRARNHGDLEALVRMEPANPAYSIDWIEGQGPFSHDLHSFVQNTHDDYHKVVIFQYLYTPSFFCTKIVPENKLIFVPLLHDEPPAYYPMFREAFRKPEWTIYNTEIEYKLAKRINMVHEKKAVVAGVGIEFDLADEVLKTSTGPEENDPFIVFAGRLGPDKLVNVLIDDFISYKEQYGGDLKLKLIGKRVTSLRRHRDIIELGFLESEREKYEIMSKALCLVNPSLYESLSLIILESFAVKRPILVNGYCEVLKDHCLKSNGGLWYESPEEFAHVLNHILKNKDQADVMGQNGYEYARSNYGWETVMKKWIDVIES